ncbi:MAG: GNAT family N-acetyltransferase [Candidatus Hermodarchaeota archaeon]
MKIENFNMHYYQEILELWKRAGIGIGSSDTKEEIEKILDRNPELFLIGKEQGKVIAVVIGAFDGRRGYVHHLAVDPKYQNNGYGKIIMDDLIDRFQRKKVHKIHLFIEKHNIKVVDFYRKQGWEIRDDLIMMSFIPDKTLYRRSVDGK